MATTLYIGNRNYSSWSMRPWLALRWGGIAFEEDVRPISVDDAVKGRAPHIMEISPSGRVPALRVGDDTIYDSLAICEWAAEQNMALWPTDAMARALARSASAEMHAGFQGLRRALPMNLKRRMAAAPAYPEDAARDLARVFALWSALRLRFGAGGPFLFGARSVADAVYAPVASRLRTYGIAGPAVINDYVETILADSAVREWTRAALEEPWIMPDTDGIYL